MIVFLDAETLGDCDYTKLEKYGEYKIFLQTSAEEAPDRIKNANVILTNKVKITSELMQKAPHLKAVIITATGMDNVDLAAADSHGIKVLNAKGYSTDSVVTHTFSMLFHFMHQIHSYHEFTAQKKWINYHQFTQFSNFHELASRRWGIIGLGTIGEKVADIANAFGSEVNYYSTSGKNSNEKYLQVDLEALLSCSDIISIHAPLNPQTKDLIQFRELELMQPGSILLNLGRGGIINEKDLSVYLKNYSKNYVGVDVLEQEPMSKDSPLVENLSDRNFLCTPHLAWASIEAREKLWQMTLANLENL